MLAIDINCDVGEGIANEEQIMSFISSCNIACGGHAGSINSIDETIKTALKYNLKIGAHPSFPDVKNFGRKVMKISDKELQRSIENQLNLCIQRVHLADGKLHHVKTHGALYNLSSTDKNIAKTVVNAVKNTISDVFLYVPFNSVIEKIAVDNNIKIIYEGFADRNYTAEGKLVSRKEKNALITDKNNVFEHLYKMITSQKVTTVSGDEIAIKAQTFCIHGDNPKVVEILQFITKELQKRDKKIKGV